MHTAIYLRVSTDKQESGLETQERAINSFLLQSNSKSPKVYKDFGVSGTKRDREGLNELLCDVENGLIKEVVVYSFSRMARSTAHLIEILEYFKTHSVRFVSITENIDTSTPMGAAMYTIIAAMSQLERDLISERVKAGMANAKAKGKQIGREKRVDGDLIQELAARKFSYRQIAAEVGCSIGTVHNELKKSA